MKVFEGLTKRLIELFGMGFIINLLVNAFFGSVVWYFTTFGKFTFYSYGPLSSATITKMFSENVLLSTFIWLIIGLFSYNFPFYYSSEYY